mmetsp:Transcript_111316/g.319855  ORF Transcript_111316/g.319855 Transcript_111316/m.319855 type:complete len:508 (+) Transcript_111316:451-1974(+)
MQTSELLRRKRLLKSSSFPLGQSMMPSQRQTPAHATHTPGLHSNSVAPQLSSRLCITSAVGFPTKAYEANSPSGVGFSRKSGTKGMVSDCSSSSSVVAFGIHAQANHLSAKSRITCASRSSSIHSVSGNLTLPGVRRSATSNSTSCMPSAKTTAPVVSTTMPNPSGAAPDGATRRSWPAARPERKRCRSAEASSSSSGPQPSRMLSERMPAPGRFRRPAIHCCACQRLSSGFRGPRAMQTLPFSVKRLATSADRSCKMQRKVSLSQTCLGSSMPDGCTMAQSSSVAQVRVRSWLSPQASCSIPRSVRLRSDVLPWQPTEHPRSVASATSSRPAKQPHALPCTHALTSPNISSAAAPQGLFDAAARVSWQTEDRKRSLKVRALPPRQVAAFMWCRIAASESSVLKMAASSTFPLKPFHVTPDSAGTPPRRMRAVACSAQPAALASAKERLAMRAPSTKSRSPSDSPMECARKCQEPSSSFGPTPGAQTAVPEEAKRRRPSASSPNFPP